MGLYDELKLLFETYEPYEVSEELGRILRDLVKQYGLNSDEFFIWLERAFNGEI